MHLGVHVSISGRIYEAVDRAALLGCTAMQIFSRNPRQWRSLRLGAAELKEFRRRRRAQGIGVVAVHVPYLINLAAVYDGLYEKSIQAYIEDIRECDALGAEYLVTHMGSYKNSTLAAGLDRFTKALDIIFEKTPKSRVRLLLENTSGSGHWLGGTFEHHRLIFDAVKVRSRLGLCLDTAHAFAAGYDIRTPSGFDALLAEIEEKLGPAALRVLHLNDSKADFGSRADRHEHIGRGFIGAPAMRYIVNHNKLKDAAVILETPKETPRSDKMNLDRVRKMLSRAQ